MRRRYDITNALIHLTGDRTEKGGLSSEDALHSILKDGIIRGSGNEGYIKGHDKAVCFTEMPLGTLKYLIEEGNPKHKYGYFGIAISKKTGWNAGARPVIYLPDDEADWIPSEEKWRHVQYNFGKIDFTHEREWRIKGDLILEKFGFYVIVPDIDYEKAIKKMQLDNNVSVNIIGFLHMSYLNDIL